MPNVTSKAGRAALADIIKNNADNASSTNTMVSRFESQALLPGVERTAEKMREDGGKGTRITSGPLANTAVDATLDAIEEHSPSTSAADARYWSKAEVADVAAADPEMGQLMQLAYARVARLAPMSKSQQQAAAMAQAAFEALGDPGAQLGRSGDLGISIDTRAGRSGRDSVPASVLDARDFMYPAEAADWASVQVRSVELDGKSYFTVALSTDGDDGLLEVYDSRGRALASTPTNAGAVTEWDSHFGLSRFNGPLSGFRGKPAEGYSEEAERITEHQPTRGWNPDVVIEDGRVDHDGTRFVDFTTSANLNAEQDEVARAAFSVLYDRHLVHAYGDDGTSFELGSRRAGSLRIGGFVHPETGVDTLVADWKDIDDGSFTLYFARSESGALKLAVEQFNN